MDKIITEIQFVIENKKDIDSIVSGSESLPQDEMHILKDSSYIEKLKTLTGNISLALYAVPNKKYSAQGYTISFTKDLRMIFSSQEQAPIVVNQKFLAREKGIFRDNDIYSSYLLCVMSPPVDIFDWLGKAGGLAPWATPDRPYGSGD